MAISRVVALMAPTLVIADLRLMITPVFYLHQVEVSNQVSASVSVISYIEN